MQYRLCLGLLLVISCSQPQTPPVTTDAQADSVINKIREDFGFYIQPGEGSTGIHYLDSIRPAIDSLHHSGLTSAWYRIRGLTMVSVGKLAEAGPYLDTSIQIARARDTLNKYYGGALVQYGHWWLFNQQYDHALPLYKEGYAISRQQHDTVHLLVAAMGLSEIYARMGDQLSRRKYLFDGLQYAYLGPDLDFFTTELAGYYEEMGQRDSTLYFVNRMLRDTALQPFDRVWKMENLGLVLTERGDFNGALQYLQQALAERKKEHSADGHIYLSISHLYLRTGQLHAARAYLDTAGLLAYQSQDYVQLEKLYESYGLLAKLERRLDAALAFTDSVQQYHLRVDSISRSREAQEVETRFAVREKDIAIKELAAEKQLATLSSQRRLLIIVAMMGAAVLLTFMGILMTRRRRLAQTLRQQQLHQRLLRTQMEPHFIYNSLHALQGFIREVQTEKAIQYLGKFAKLSQVSLVNAREDFVPLDQELTALDAYLALQQIHHPGLSFDITLDLRDDPADLEIPPMLLQPFVENAVLH